MRLGLVPFLLAMAHSAGADTVFATNTVRARDTIRADDVQIKDVDVAGAATDLATVIGSEATRAIYAGRPVRLSDLGRPALVERNQLLQAIFNINGLTIEIEVRALERGAPGEIIRAMNTSSRATIFAEVQKDGRLKVMP